jgi:hypothetical protein
MKTQIKEILATAVTIICFIAIGVMLAWRG